MRAIPLTLWTLSGCATLNGARPLSPGEHAVGLTLGGALMQFAGAPIPLPNAVIEGRHGLPLLASRPLDVSYGLNATALPFGFLQGHAGISWLLLQQREARPALSLTDRLFFALDPAPQGWAADQIELTASWLVGQQLVYTSLSEYLDFGRPSLLLTPALGAVFDLKEPGGITFQTELRYYGVHRSTELETLPFLPSNPGILGVSIGLSAPFGGKR